MQVYARPGWKMARQLTGDLFVLGSVVCWALGARLLAHAVEKLAVPARQTGNAAHSMSEQMRQAEERIGQLPGLGDNLGDPFGSMAGGLQQISEQSAAQVDLVHRLALVSGWLVFLLPTLTILALWLPRRIRFIRQAAAARTFIDADADLDLFALRAMANVPMAQLARITPDPVGEWRRGNAAVVRQLAALELERTGLALPEPVRRRQ
ncbi:MULTISPECIES: hypothetical protein [unclassified Luteococcus]|uniref:hypothetical protein n=1 Tax=unclassified Luteococcus TaxID=2639923 RepID=UPI00313C3FC5